MPELDQWTRRRSVVVVVVLIRFVGGVGVGQRIDLVTALSRRRSEHMRQQAEHRAIRQLRALGYDVSLVA